MKKGKKSLLSIAVSCLLLTSIMVGCKRDADNGNPLNGMWVMSKMVYPGGEEFDYPRNGTTRLRIYQDSILYMCQMTTSQSGIVITPDSKEPYTYIDKGNGDCFYLEDGHRFPLIQTSDTSIIVQQYGVRYTYQRYHGDLEQRVGEIRKIIEMDEDYTDENARRYVISAAERELERTNNTLGVVCITAAAVMFFLMYYSYQVHRNKKRVEYQLCQMEKERSLRPLPLQNALNEVETEFLHSEYYHRLRKQVADGKHLNAEDWSELDSRIMSVYPQFHSSLLALCPMSQTEIQVCSLIRIRFAPSEIATAMSKETSTVSSIRSRLYRKVFDRKGSSKDWDEFILSL